MATRDMRSDIQVRLVFEAAITSDTTTDATAVDTADFDMGVTFAMMASDFTDGEYQLQFEDSPDNITFAPVAAEKIIGPNDPVIALTDATAIDGTERLKTVGVFSTDRYVKAQIVSTGVTTGADIEVMAILGGEQNPVADL